MKSALGALPFLLIFASALACSAKGSDVAAPTFTPGQGQAKAGNDHYPAGPYGVAEGSVINDFDFLGFTNSVAQRDPNALEPIRLAHFYNPHVDDATYAALDADHDDRLFPPGSPYGAGKPKPRALLLDVSSVWCPPCNEEAKTVLPAKRLKYSACGGEFLQQLADGITPGVAATPKNLVAWTTRYQIDYPAVIDPSSKLQSLFQQDAFPANIIVDTRSMKVVKSMNGVPNNAFWGLYEKTLNNASCLAVK
ncbi:MAG: hypothetical protein NVS3B20_00840 [Polyangiales bacterium]